MPAYSLVIKQMIPLSRTGASLTCLFLEGGQKVTKHITPVTSQHEQQDTCGGRLDPATMEAEVYPRKKAVGHT